MKKLFLCLLMAIVFAPVFGQAGKKDTTFTQQYLAQKAKYMEELKKDSFLITIPIVSKGYYQGTIEVRPGVVKNHFVKNIRTHEEWNYPQFKEEEFEKWLLQKDTIMRKTE